MEQTTRAHRPGSGPKGLGAKPRSARFPKSPPDNPIGLLPSSEHLMSAIINRIDGRRDNLNHRPLSVCSAKVTATGAQNFGVIGRQGRAYCGAGRRADSPLAAGQFHGARLACMAGRAMVVVFSPRISSGREFGASYTPRTPGPSEHRHSGGERMSRAALSRSSVCAIGTS